VDALGHVVPIRNNVDEVWGGEGAIPVVFVPCNVWIVIKVSFGDREDIGISITSQVRRVYISSPDGVSGDDFLLGEEAVSEVFVPRDLVVVKGGREDVRVSIVGQIHRIDALRPIGFGSNDLLGHLG